MNIVWKTLRKMVKILTLQLQTLMNLRRAKPVFNKTINLPSINDLEENHFVRQYIENRKIPKEKWSGIFFAEDFMKFILETFPECDKKLKENEPRIVLPFYNEKNILQGVQGRVLDNSTVRYITIRASPRHEKVLWS